MKLSDRIEAFARLGNYLKENLHDLDKVYPSGDMAEELYFKDPELIEIAQEARAVNPWFTTVFIYQALKEISLLLDKPKLEEWCGRYPLQDFQPASALTVGTILAGNIPLVGFHDFLSVLLSGHRFIGKMSGKDDKILPFLADKIQEYETRFSEHIHFEESYLNNIDAIIATGSNNSSRYFEYYFGKYPHIFRRNRNGVAILSGNESVEDLTLLADDIFLYFGMGCRNIAKLYVPLDYNFNRFFEAMENYHHVIDHHKYANNYLYQRSIFLMNIVEHLDNGFLLVLPDKAIASPVGTLHYEFYENPEVLVSRLSTEQGSIQCIAGLQTDGLSTIKFGSTQHPGLWDYADNMDTLNFLSNLYEN